MGLRRAASGVANIILTHGYDFDLDELLRFAVGLGRQAVEMCIRDRRVNVQVCD